MLALIAQHAGVSAASVGLDSSIWDSFPTSSNAGEHPTVTSFCDEVQSEFKVYLTEEEWEDPTIDDLAQSIRAKLENPEASLADWTLDRESTLKGVTMTAVMSNVLFGTIGVLVASGSWTRRVLVMGCLLLAFDVAFLLVYRAEAKKRPLSH